MPGRDSVCADVFVSVSLWQTETSSPQTGQCVWSRAQDPGRRRRTKRRCDRWKEVTESQRPTGESCLPPRCLNVSASDCRGRNVSSVGEFSSLETSVLWVRSLFAFSLVLFMVTKSTQWRFRRSREFLHAHLHAILLACRLKCDAVLFHKLVN